MIKKIINVNFNKVSHDPMQINAKISEKGKISIIFNRINCQQKYKNIEYF